VKILPWLTVLRTHSKQKARQPGRRMSNLSQGPIHRSALSQRSCCAGQAHRVQSVAQSPPCLSASGTLGLAVGDTWKYCSSGRSLMLECSSLASAIMIK
jgi:hypothetical protein